MTRYTHSGLIRHPFQFLDDGRSRTRPQKHQGIGFVSRRTTATLCIPQAMVRSDAQRSTIYALSTPPGKAGVAVIRVSGPESLQVWRSMVSVRLRKGKNKESLPESWKMYRCDVVHPSTRELLDSGLAVYFKGTPLCAGVNRCQCALY